MARSPLHHIVSAVVTTVLAAGALQGCAGGGSVFGGCTDRDRRLVSILAELPILDSHPERASLTREDQHCDTDDGFASASKQYRTALERERILAFYRAAAKDDGWRSNGDNPPPPTTGLVITAARSCYTKEVDGTTAYLIVWFPSDLNAAVPAELQAPRDAYGIGITGSHDGAAWC